MKFYVTEDEWYPVYELEAEEDAESYEKRFCRCIEVDEAFMRRYRRAFKAFDRLQTEIEELQDKAPAPPRDEKLFGVATQAVVASYMAPQIADGFRL